MVNGMHNFGLSMLHGFDIKSKPDLFFRISMESQSDMRFELKSNQILANQPNQM